ncbi:MAG: hypothetical protein WA840_24160 [Caulobacteraceae bacterium]
MIRTVLISTAALFAVAGVANAAPIKISLAGKTEATVKAEIFKAAATACADAQAMEYSTCVQESAQDALKQVAKVKALRTASLTF